MGWTTHQEVVRQQQETVRFQYRLIFLAISLRHIWHVRSVCEQLSHAPWPHRKATLRRFSIQIEQV